MNYTLSDYEPSRTVAYASPAANHDQPLRRLAYWINERQRITNKREAGLPKPWTTDPILQRFKFCSVRREDDRVTRWLDANWRHPHYDDPRAWFTMGVARLINWPDTLEAIKYPKPWNADRTLQRMRARRTAGLQTFTGAYMITNAGRKLPKEDTVVLLLNNLHALPDPPTRGDTLAAAHAKLRNADCAGMGSFIAAQVIADCKHMKLLADAADWHDWAAPGPGSMRGLSRIIQEPAPKRPEAFVAALLGLRKAVQPFLAAHVPELCLQDLQNCLCEFDKNERTLWGEGRPRSLYPGA